MKLTSLRKSALALLMLGTMVSSAIAGEDYGSRDGGIDLLLILSIGAVLTIGIGFVVLRVLLLVLKQKPGDTPEDLSSSGEIAPERTPES